MRNLCLMAALLPVLVCGVRADEPRHDRYRNVLPDGAISRLGFHRSGTSSPLNTGDGTVAAFSPDGKLFASVCHQHLYLWDIDTGRVKHALRAPERAVEQVVFARGGRWLLGREVSGRIHAWEVATGKQVWSSPDTMFTWGSVLISKKGRWIIDARETLWNADKMEAVVNSKYALDYMPAGFSPDERFLFRRIGKREGDKNDFTLEKWDLAANKLVHYCNDYPEAGVTVLPDGKTVAGVEIIRDPKEVNKFLYAVTLFDTDEAKIVRRIGQVKPPLNAPAFSHDGKLVAASDNLGTTHLWETATGKSVRTWKSGLDSMIFLAFAPDGKTLGAVGRGGTVALWDIDSGKARWLTGELLFRVTAMQFSGDGRRMAAGYADGSIRVWNTREQTETPKTRIGEDFAYSGTPILDWAGDERFLIFQKQYAEYSLLDWQAGKEIPLTLGKGIDVVGLFGPSRTLIVGPPRARSMHDTSWTPLKQEQIKAAREEVARRPELKGFRVLSPAPAVVRDARRMQFFGQSAEMAVPTHPETLSADGKYGIESMSELSGIPSSGMGVYWAHQGYRLVDVARGHVLREFKRPVGRQFFSPDGRSLAVSSDRESKTQELILLETRTGQERWRVKTAKHVGSLRFSPCGRFIVHSEHEGDGLHILDTRDGSTVSKRTVTRHYNGLDPLAISPDGKVIARADPDGTIIFWEMPAPPAAKRRDLSEAELQEAWRALADSEGLASFQAMLRLVDSPQALALLRGGLLLENEQARIDKLVADLNGPAFADRQRAARELEALGEKARPTLVKALKAGPGLESQRRIERLLQGIAIPFATPAGVRQLRAIETLERIGTEEARAILAPLAKGPLDDPLCFEAHHSLQRLQARDRR